VLASINAQIFGGNLQHCCTNFYTTMLILKGCSKSKWKRWRVGKKLVKSVVEMVVAMMMKPAPLHLGLVDAPESEDDGPHQSESLSFESDSGDDEAQDIFEDWVVSLPALQRKTRAVLLMQSFRTRQKMSTGQEAASITGFNEKTVRLFQEREL